MTVAILLVTLAISVVLAGGPRDFMVACERGLKTVVESLHQSWRSFRS